MPATKNIYTALLAAQAEFPVIERGASGQVGTRAYKYADLPSILEKIQPVLRTHGILGTQTPVILDGDLMLRTTLRHVESETEIVGHTPLPVPDDWQRWGSAVTYARRYSLLPMLGIAPDDDDDGVSAQGFRQRAPEQPVDEGHGICPIHHVPFFQSANMNSPAHKPTDGSRKWCNKSDVENEQKARDIATPPDIQNGGFQQGARNLRNDEQNDMEREMRRLLSERFHGEARPMMMYVSNVVGHSVKVMGDLNAAEIGMVYSALVDDENDAAQVQGDEVQQPEFIIDGDRR